MAHQIAAEAVVKAQLEILHVVRVPAGAAHQVVILDARRVGRAGFVGLQIHVGFRTWRGFGGSCL
jgi:hypothetical protein